MDTLTKQVTDHHVELKQKLNESESRHCERIEACELEM